jgi:hypothetical protein
MIDVLSRYSYRCPGNCTASSKQRRISSLAAAAVAQPRENAKMASLIYYFEIITTAFQRFGQILGPRESQSPSRSSLLALWREFRSAARVHQCWRTSYTREQKGMFGALSESTKEKKSECSFSLSLARSAFRLGCDL